MLENGMLIDAARYDVQQREPQMVKCCHCNELVPAYDTVQIGGKTVCGDCLHDYCNDQYDLLGGEYLRENADRYEQDEHIPLASDDLFLNWWFANLERSDRLHILKRTYALERAIHGAYYPEWERDYCVNANDWENFVQERG